MFLNMNSPLKIFLGNKIYSIKNRSYLDAAAGASFRVFWPSGCDLRDCPSLRDSQPDHPFRYPDSLLRTSSLWPPLSHPLRPQWLVHRVTCTHVERTPEQLINKKKRPNENIQKRLIEGCREKIIG